MNEEVNVLFMFAQISCCAARQSIGQFSSSFYQKSRNPFFVRDANDVIHFLWKTNLSCGDA